MTKGLIIDGPGWIALAPFWVSDDIESWTFRICLFLNFLKPLKIWCHLDNFYLYCFMGGTKGKNLKTSEICQKGAKAIQPGPTMIRLFNNRFLRESGMVFTLKMEYQNILKKSSFKLIGDEFFRISISKIMVPL